MPSRDDPPANDIRGLIRRAGEMARAEHVADVFSRMNEDDQQDQADGVAEDSQEAPSRVSDSSSWFDSTSTGGVDQSAQAGDAEDDRPTLDSPPPSQEPSLSGRPSIGTPSTLISTPRFRPTRRPPMATVRVYDDDQREAEVVRLRQTPFVIGRQDGDLVIGHERQMSRRHARIDRVQEGDLWRWYLGDLRSTNGTFVRTGEAALEDGVEVLLGGELVRFLASPTGGPPSLVKVAPSSDEQRVALQGESHLVGTDPAKCLDFLRDSPFLDPAHLRVERRGGRWRVVDLASTNHLWVAVTKRYELQNGSMFQIGEQRFSFHLP